MSSDGAPEAIPGLQVSGRRFGIVASRFHEEIVDRLLQGAKDCLLAHGAAEGDVVSVRVPGAWEIPLALKSLADRGDLDGVIGLGVVIRGETPHFDFICTECSRQCGQLATAWGRPVGFGLLTCNTREQAEERAGGNAGNKGWESALACIEMSDVVRKIPDL